MSTRPGLGRSYSEHSSELPKPKFTDSRSFSDDLANSSSPNLLPSPLLLGGSPGGSDEAQTNARRRILNRVGAKLIEEKSKVEDEIESLKRQLEAERNARRTETELYARAKARLATTLDERVKEQLDVRLEEERHSFRLALQQELAKSNLDWETEKKALLSESNLQTDASSRSILRTDPSQGDAKISRLESNLETLSSELKEQTSRLKEALEERNSLVSTLDKESRKLQEVTFELEKIQEKFVNSSERADNAESEVKRLQVDVEAAQSLVSLVAQLQTDLEAERSRAEKLDVAGSTIEEVKLEHEALKVENATLQHSLEEANNQISMLKAEHLQELADVEKSLLEVRADLGERIVVLENENAALITQVKLLTEEIAKANAESTNSTLESRSVSAEANSSREKLESTQAELEAVTEQNSLLSSQLAEIHAELEQEKSRANQREQDVLSSEVRLQASILQLNEAVETQNRLEADLEMARANETLRAAASEEILQTTSELEHLRAVNLQQSSRIAQLEAEVDTMRLELLAHADNPMVTQLSDQVSSITEELGQAQALNKEKDSKIEVLEGSVAELQTVKHALAEAQGECSRLKIENKELEVNLTEAHGNVANLEAHIKQLEARVEEAGAGGSAMTSVLAEQIATLSAELQQTHDELNETKTNELSLRENVAVLEAQIGDMRDLNGASEKNWERSIAQLTVELEGVQTDAKHSKLSLQQATREHAEVKTRLEERLAAKTSSLAEKEAQLEASEAMISSLQEQIKSLEQENEAASRMHAELEILVAQREQERDGTKASLEESETLVSSLNERLGILQAEMEMNSRGGSVVDEKVRTRQQTLEKEIELLREDKARVEKEFDRVRDRNFVLEKSRKNAEDLETTIRALEQDSARATADVETIKANLKAVQEEKTKHEEESRAEIEMLRRDMTYVKSENYRLQNISEQQASSKSSQRVEELERHVEQLTAQSENDKVKIKALEDKVASLSSAEAASKSSLDDVLRAKDDAVAKVQSSIDEIAYLKSQLGKSSDQVSQLQRDVKAKEEDLSHALSQLRELKQDTKSKEEDADSLRRNAPRETSELLARLQQEQQRLRDNEAELLSLKTSLSSEQSKAKEQESQLIALRTLSEGKSAALTLEYNKTRDDVVKLKAELDTIKASLTTETSRVEALNSELSSTKILLAAEQAKLQTAHARLAEHQGDGNSLVTKLQSQIKDERESGLANARRVESLTIQLNDSQAQLEDVTKEIIRMGKLLNEEQRRSEKLKSDNEDFKKRIDRAQQDIAEAAAPSIKLGEKIMLITEQLEDERVKNESMHRDLAAYNEEVKRLSARLAEEQARREKAEAGNKAGSRPRRSSVIESSNV